MIVFENKCFALYGILCAEPYAAGIGGARGRMA